MEAICRSSDSFHLRASPKSGFRRTSMQGHALSIHNISGISGLSRSSGRHYPSRQCQSKQSPPIRAQVCDWGTLHGARRPATDHTPELGPWEGLLPTLENPTLDEGLRREILKYGDLTQLTYDGFISQIWDPKKRFGLPRKEDPQSFIESMDVPLECLALPQGYRAVKYLYAKSGIFEIESAKNIEEAPGTKNQGNWIGYVAVSNPLSDKGEPQENGGKVDIAIFFRGTILREEWLTNVGGDYLQPWQPDGEVKGNWKYDVGLGLTNVGGAMAGTSTLLHLVLFTISGAAATLATSSNYLAGKGWKPLADFFAAIASGMEALVGPVSWTAVGAAALFSILGFVAGLGLVSFAGPMVHRGFQDVYRTVAPEAGAEVPNSSDTGPLRGSPPKQVIEETLEKLLAPGQPTVRSITTSGHSLGGALATLSAAHIAHWLKNNWSNSSEPPPQVSAFTFAAPRVGNKGFVNLLWETPVLKVVNKDDIVPKAPGVLLSIYPLLEGAFPWLSSFSFVLALWKLTSGVWAYTDTLGETLTVDSVESKILRKVTLADGPGAAHNLELHLWLVATLFNGQEEPVGSDGKPNEEAFRKEDKNLELVDRVRRGIATEVDKRDLKAEKLSLATRRDYALTNKSENSLDGAAKIPPAFYGPSPWETLHDTDYGKWRFPRRAHDFETP